MDYNVKLLIRYEPEGHSEEAVDETLADLTESAPFLHACLK